VTDTIIWLPDRPHPASVASNGCGWCTDPISPGHAFAKVAITGREPSDSEREKLCRVQVHQAVFQARKILQRDGRAIVWQVNVVKESIARS